MYFRNKVLYESAWVTDSLWLKVILCIVSSAGKIISADIQFSYARVVLQARQVTLMLRTCRADNPHNQDGVTQALTTLPLVLSETSERCF